MSVVNSVEDLYRKPVEAIAALTWLGAAAITGISAFATSMPHSVGAGLVGCSLAMALRRGFQTKELVDAKLNLAGHEWWTIPTQQIEDAMRRKPKSLWLGKGFEWTAEHTRRAYHLNDLGVRDMMPPKWLLKLMRRPHDFEEIKGAPWIHGLEPEETEGFVPWQHAEGNWKIFGATGSGKTRLYEVLLYQMVKRGDVVIIIDPKFDKDLLATAKRACAAAGRPDALAFFHPAFPSQSVRLDLMANYTRVTELASRISDIVPGEDDNFKAFVWSTVQAINSGLFYLGERPSFKKVRQYTDNGPEELLERVLAKFLAQWRPEGWEDLVKGREAAINMRKGPNGGSPMKTGSIRVQAMVWVYMEDVEQSSRRQDVSGLVSVAIHNREHLGKMISGFKPQITKLTSGSLEELLSPDYDDPNDHREILDTDKIIRGGRVLYFCSDSLADATVGSTLAGVLVSDAKGAIGSLYNNETRASDATRYLHILGDEASEWVNDSAISLANKGRGAGVITWFASQNFSDYVVKLGSEDKARMVLGNCNNTICLRTVDDKTQKYVVDCMGTVGVASVEKGRSANVRSESIGLEVGSTTTTRIATSDKDRFPSFLLGRMGDLHYISITSGGKVFKGRLGKVKLPEAVH